MPFSFIVIFIIYHKIFTYLKTICWLIFHRWKIPDYMQWSPRNHCQAKLQIVRNIAIFLFNYKKVRVKCILICLKWCGVGPKGLERPQDFSASNFVSHTFFFLSFFLFLPPSFISLYPSSLPSSLLSFLLCSLLPSFLPLSQGCSIIAVWYWSGIK